LRKFDKDFRLFLMIFVSVQAKTKIFVNLATQFKQKYLLTLQPNFFLQFLSPQILRDPLGQNWDFSTPWTKTGIFLTPLGHKTGFFTPLGGPLQTVLSNFTPLGQLFVPILPLSDSFFPILPP